MSNYLLLTHHFALYQSTQNQTLLLSLTLEATVLPRIWYIKGISYLYINTNLRHACLLT